MAESRAALATVKAQLSIPEEAIDLARAKLALDALIDPTIDIQAALARVDQVVKTIRQMPGGKGSDRERMTAIRTYIYEPGSWNAWRPYRYDLDDPFGKVISHKLIPHYLETRLGNCVTMPMLFLILAERLGIEVGAATSPEHMFVRVRDRRSDRTFNVETTSGAHVARDEWYQQQMPMTSEAIANGVYMKTLTRRQTVAVLAGVVAEHYLSISEPEVVISIADAMLEAYPALASAYVMKGSAYAMMINQRFRQEYPTVADIPRGRVHEYDDMVEQSIAAFRRAEELGWREPLGRSEQERTDD